MSDAPRPSNFLTDIVEADLRAGKNGGRVVTRFPPEPNGFLHIGHAKSILLNFGLAQAYGGRTHLRFDDTNPVTEETEYVEAIQADVRWLGCDWGEHLYYASDFFEQMYECAERLVREGKAYVDSQTQDQIREQRGSFERPGVNSPFRDRPPAESLDLLRRMRAGEFADGAACCAPGSTWRTPTCSCAIRSSTGSGTRTTTGPATPGASTRCTTSRTRSRTRSRA